MAENDLALQLEKACNRREVLLAKLAGETLSEAEQAELEELQIHRIPELRARILGNRSSRRPEIDPLDLDEYAAGLAEHDIQPS